MRTKFSLLLGFPRSGTTWIHNCCSYNWRVGRIAEPDNPHNNPCSSWQMSSRFAPAGSSDAAASNVFDVVFRNPEHFNSRYRYLRPFASCYCIKSVLGMMMGEWMQRYGQMPVCFVARNPVAVVMSCQKMIHDPLGFWECLRGQPQLEPVLGDSWGLVQRRPTSPAAAIATVWAAQQRVIQKQLSNHSSWRLFKYEDVCSKPLQGILRVTQCLGLPFGLIDKLRVVATTFRNDGRFHGVRRKSSAMADSWRYTAPHELVREVANVCSEFEFPIYSEEEVAAQRR
jgi:hypothetical protein